MRLPSWIFYDGDAIKHWVRLGGADRRRVQRFQEQRGGVAQKTKSLMTSGRTAWWSRKETDQEHQSEGLKVFTTQKVGVMVRKNSRGGNQESGNSAGKPRPIVTVEPVYRKKLKGKVSEGQAVFFHAQGTS